MQLGSITKVIGYADLTDADTEMDISIGAAAPAGAIFLNFTVNETIVFAASGLTWINVSLGNSNHPALTFPMGSMYYGPWSATVTAYGNIIGGDTMNLRVKCSGANLDTLTAGSLTCVLHYATA